MADGGRRTQRPVIPSGSHCHPERQRGIFCDGIVA